MVNRLQAKLIWADCCFELLYEDSLLNQDVEKEFELAQVLGGNDNIYNELLLWLQDKWQLIAIKAFIGRIENVTDLWRRRKKCEDG